MERLIAPVLSKGGCILISADHGNVEEIKNPFTGEVNTEHSSNPVPLWFITGENHRPGEASLNQEPQGLLSDIAATILELFGMKKPEEMTGSSLLSILQ